MSDQNIKNFFIIVFTISCFSLAAALYVEYILNFKPCILCVYQRIPYAIALLISLIAFFNDNKKTLLVILGLILKLVGVEYDLQKQEAAYRKILVIAEDDGGIRPKTLDELFHGVRQIHFKSYLYYLYFSIGRLAYLQANVLAAYIFLAPAIVAGVMTLGVMQQIIRAFGRVEGSLQYLFRAWPTIIELASVYKRLREFESKIAINMQEENLEPSSE